MVKDGFLFNQDPETSSGRQVTVDFEVAGIQLQCETKPDLFSPKNLDSGTKLLLETLTNRVIPSLSKDPEHSPASSRDLSTDLDYQSSRDDKMKILDWGCGWGAIGLTLAKLWPSAQVTALDSDIAAVSTTKQNATLNNINNIEVVSSYSFDGIKDKKFDLIASNPPTHRGREVVEQMIALSFEQLNQNGQLAIVVEARLKPWVARKMKEQFDNCKIAKRGPKHVVLISKK